MGITRDMKINLDGRKNNRRLQDHGQENESADEDEKYKMNGKSSSSSSSSSRSTRTEACCGNNGYGMGANNNSKGLEVNAGIPAGSWVQHVHEEGFMFWRNTHTGECTRDLWFGPRGPPTRFCPRLPEHRQLMPAPFESVAPKKNDPSPPRKAGKWKGKGKEKDTNKLPTTWFCQPWEEIYHPVTGEKHWRHRDTGEKRYKDPLW